MKSSVSNKIMFQILNFSIISVLILSTNSPALADMFKPSANQQTKLGDQAAAQVLRKYREVKDERADRFRQLGQRLVNALSPGERGPWKYQFHVIESKEVNAFALPGGQMFMFTGLLNRIHSNSELAAVTGHEMTHVRKEHWAKAYAGQQERQLGLGILLGIFRANNTLRIIGGVTESAYTLKYSRSEEDQADEGGLKNMVAAGYDPNGMIYLFHTLQQASKGDGSMPDFLSDHPLTTNRIKKTQQRIDAMNGIHSDADGAIKQTDRNDGKNQADDKDLNP